METIISTTDIICVDSRDELLLEVKDPLENLNNFGESPKYYRLNETVFAEPFEMQDKIVGTEVSSEISLIDNFIIQKHPGKRNKYYIDIDKSAAELKCPKPDCNRTFSTTTLLRAHVRRLHCADNTRCVCEVCGDCFSAPYLLRRHAARHGPPAEPCPVCGRVLSARTDMSVHLRRHYATRPHGCPICNRSFVRRAELTAHACGSRSSRSRVTKHTESRPK